VLAALMLMCGCACLFLRLRCRAAGQTESANGGSGYAPVVDRSSSTTRLLPTLDGGGAKRAAVAAALLDDCDEADEADLDDFDVEEMPVSTKAEPLLRRQTDKMAAELKKMDADAMAIYGMSLAEDGRSSPRYDLPHDLEDDPSELDDEIGPDDSISVAWFKAQKPREPTPSVPRAVPVTIEAPDGSRHAMDVQLEGLQSTAELRRGMLQGYRELLGGQLQAQALRVHARLVSGSSVLLLDDTPLTHALLGSIDSFYVWTARDACGARSTRSAESDSESVPSLAQRKERLMRSSRVR